MMSSSNAVKSPEILEFEKFIQKIDTKDMTILETGDESSDSSCDEQVIVQKSIKRKTKRHKKVN